MLFEKIANLIVKHNKIILVCFTVLIFIAGGIGALVFNRLDTAGYSDPNSESYKAAQYLKDEFHTKNPAIVLIVDSQNLSINAPPASGDAQLFESMVRKLEGVSHTFSYWSSGNVPIFISKDGKASYFFVYTKSDNPQDVEAVVQEIQDKFNGKFKSLKIYATGSGVIDDALNHTIAKDLFLAESISIPLTFGLLLFVFGTLVSSLIPILMGIFSILGALFLLWLVTTFTSVSVFALNLVTGMGLGLGIDYSLLIVNRFREEFHRTNDTTRTVINTFKTAGKTVFYSGLTVMVTLGALLFFPLPFLKSFGYAGVSVVFLAILSAVLPLPALLSMLGTRVDKGVIRKGALLTKPDGSWKNLVRFVMRYPVSVSIVCLLILCTFAWPIRNIVFSQTDVDVLPADSQAVIAYHMLQERFPDQASNPIEIIIPHGKNKMESVDNYMKALSKVPGVARINPPQFNDSDVHITAIQSFDVKTSEAKQMIRHIRALPKPPGTLVGGDSADFLDSQDAIKHALPAVFIWISCSILILMFVFTGSLILPIKAVFLNALSLAATMGVLTFIFIEGHLQWLVGDFTLTGSLDTGTCIMVAVVVFGLSMDYELFLLSRIKEEYLVRQNNETAITFGLQKSANIITAAALILAAVFAAFVTSHVTPIKVMGFGVAFAVLLDATLIRAFLVPALMRILGKSNWWAPKFLQKFTINH